jgi:hypothetical protein
VSLSSAPIEEDFSAQKRQFRTQPETQIYREAALLLLVTVQECLTRENLTVSALQNFAQDDFRARHQTLLNLVQQKLHKTLAAMEENKVYQLSFNFEDRVIVRHRF